MNTTTIIILGAVGGILFVGMIIGLVILGRKRDRRIRDAKKRENDRRMKQDRANEALIKWAEENQKKTKSK